MTTMQATLTNTPADPTQTTINLTIVDKNGNPTTLTGDGQNNSTGPTIKTIPITLASTDINPEQSHLECRQIGDITVLSGQITTNKETPADGFILVAADIPTKREIAITPTPITDALADLNSSINTHTLITLNPGGLAIKPLGTTPLPANTTIHINTTYITQ